MTAVGGWHGRSHGLEIGESVHDQLAEAYAAHYVHLVRLARQLLDDVESAEEAVQDVFVRLHRPAAPPDPSYAYLRTAVLNQCRSSLRRRVLRRRPVGGEICEGRQHDALEAEVADRDQIRLAITRLSRRQREVVVLRYYEDLRLQDIAAILHLSVNATSVALSRALESISTYVRAER
jgi:RNA polymerase sigma factor (sigma-70 family)